MTFEELRALAVPRRHHRRQSAKARGMLSPVQCGEKAKFTSRRQAQRAATSIAEANGDRRMACYRCELCHMFHLTAKESS